MSTMFQECNVLENLELNFNTENVTNMGCMFNECHKLKEIKGINKFNTNQVTNMGAMFQECNVLEKLELNFNTENVTDMSFMFYNCNKLTDLNLKSFKLKKECKVEKMFNFDKSKCKFICDDNNLRDLYNN